MHVKTQNCYLRLNILKLIMMTAQKVKKQWPLCFYIFTMLNFMSGEFYLNYRKKRLDQVKPKNHQSKKNHEKLQWLWGEKGEKRRKEDNSQKSHNNLLQTVYRAHLHMNSHTDVSSHNFNEDTEGMLWNAFFKSGSCQLCLWSIHRSLNKFSGLWPILKIHNITKWNRNDRLFHVMGVCTVWYNFSVQTM